MADASTLGSFSQLFRGRRDIWGSVTGRSNKEEVTDKNYEAHLNGKVSLGIYPLLEDGRCHFFALDLDEKDFAKAKSIRQGFVDIHLPVYICMSKSKGYHVYGFAEDYFLAKDVRQIAHRVIAKLGISCEIFPKQDMLDGTIKYGNYINIPCFGNRRLFIDLEHNEIPTAKALAKIQSISLDDIHIAFGFLPEERQAEILKPTPSTRTRVKKPRKHPPCIERLIKGCEQGVRDVAAFALARHYLDQGYGLEEAVVALVEWDAKNTPPLNNARTLEEKVKSAAKGYAFGCNSITKEPRLQSYCIGYDTCGFRQRFNRTDVGNAERLVARHGDDIRFNVMEKTWYVWTGKVWKADQGRLLIRKLAKDTARHIFSEAAIETDDEETDALAKHASKSESSRAIDAMISLAEAEDGVAVEPDDFDSDPWLLNCRNGTLNLETGLLQSHDRNDLLSKMAPVDFDANAVSDEWEKFLKVTFADDKEMIEFIQRALGYSITGSTSERALFFCHGGGSNGKTQLLEAVSYSIGKDIYAAETEPATFMLKQRFAQGNINEPLAKLRGINLVTATETEQSQRLAVGLLKRATGGESLWHEEKFEHGYMFKPRFTLWLSLESSTYLAFAIIIL